MRDVIQHVIATEAEARGLVAAARAEAARLLSDAQQRSQDLVALSEAEDVSVRPSGLRIKRAEA
jgi:vacuolar-type H+-ATPase subunit H